MSRQVELTNLLYIKDEVVVSLITSLLNKSEKAIYWAYELYYSGLEEELFDILSKVYYYFFYTLNPKFKSFIERKKNEWLETNDIQIINKIISNFLIKPHNLDVFMLIQTAEKTKLPGASSESYESQLGKWIEERKYATVAKYILHVSENYQTNMERIIALAEIIEKLTLAKPKNNLILKPDYYSPLEINLQLPLYRILETYCKETTNEDGLHGAFNLSRNKISYEDLKKIYRENWLYHACFSPVWLSRVESYGGLVDHSNKRIIFEQDEIDCEDREEEFYNHFGLEPDEQKREVHEKSIPEIHDVKVEEFYNKFKGNRGIYDVKPKILEKILKLKFI
jgi:hypothetical protein